MLEDLAITLINFPHLNLVRGAFLLLVIAASVSVAIVKNRFIFNFFLTTSSVCLVLMCLGFITVDYDTYKEQELPKLSGVAASCISARLLPDEKAGKTKFSVNTLSQLRAECSDDNLAVGSDLDDRLI